MASYCNRDKRNRIVFQRSFPIVATWASEPAADETGVADRDRAGIIRVDTPGRAGRHTQDHTDSPTSSHGCYNGGYETLPTDNPSATAALGS
jgi:hypothetical protein